MSVVAWDGTHMAADRQATCGDMRRRTVKLVRSKDGKRVFSWTGTESLGRILMAWYEDGRDPAKWPAAQATTDWTRMLVAHKDRIEEWQQHPAPTIHPIGRIAAWGSGRDFAMGALATGSSAKHAELIASRYNVACGMGVTVMRVRK